MPHPTAELQAETRHAPGADRKSAMPHPRLILFIVSLLALWLVVINRFRAEWTLNPEYSYGWFVPLLCLYLIFERWKSGKGGQRAEGKGQRAEIGDRRSEDGPNNHQPITINQAVAPNNEQPRTINPAASTSVIIFAAAIAVLYLPTRILNEANPIWRLPMWAMGIELTGITLALVFLTLGRRWTKQFAFPILFFLVAIPWPTPLRVVVVDTLTRLNVAVGIETLGWLGIPALQRGNVVEIATGMVGIEEACSGIRSFQSTLMIGLFFGELYRFTISRRIYLVLGGILLAFTFNVIRTVLLVTVASRDGLDAIQKWHDPIGVPILVGCFLGVWALATYWRKADGPPSDLRPPPSDLRPLTSDVRSPTSDLRSPISAFPLSFSMALAIWFLLAEAGTEAWYRLHEGRLELAAEWSAVVPPSAVAVKEVPVPPASFAKLRYDTGTSVSWMDNAARRWHMFYFRWLPAVSLHDRVRIQLGLGHRPDICVPASGYQLQKEVDVTDVNVAGLVLPFRTYVFDDGGRPLHVFHCQIDDRLQEPAPSNLFPDQGPTHRLNAAWDGRRHNGFRLLELGVWGSPDVDQARAALRDVLREIVVVGR